MLYKHQIKFLPWLVLAATVASTSFISLANAASLSNMTDIVGNNTINAVTSHTIQFVATNGLAASGNFTLLFDTGFTGISVLNTWTNGDVSIFTAAFSAGSCGSFTLQTEASAITGVAWSHSASLQTLTILGPSAVVAANTCIKISLNGTDKITNPGSVGSYEIAIASSAGDSGALAVPILGSGGNLSTVTATVDPVITFALTGTPCSLANMNATTITGCALVSTVSTNGLNGYTASVLDGTSDHTLRRTGSVDTIAVATGVAVNAALATTAAFGVTTSQTFAGQGINQSASTCPTVTGTSVTITGLNASNKTYASATGPVSGHVANVCVRAKPAATTPAGAYTTTLTFTAVGNF